uniref:Uncharacterized protein n=1 Tax=Oryza brachyantha TaxID=4533 RepID=J3LKS4_ORYBR
EGTVIDSSSRKLQLLYAIWYSVFICGSFITASTIYMNRASITSLPLGGNLDDCCLSKFDV